MTMLCRSIGTLVGLTISGLALAQGAQLLRPGNPFDADSGGPAPDYSLLASWAAHPDVDDAADVAPRGAYDRQEDAEVDVFFVHPTTYLIGGSWNGDITSRRINRATDRKSMRNQASIFNAVGRVFAPRYRQGVLYAYMNHDADSLQAREHAFSDVLAAFDYFDQHARQDRPFIIAGHSQGSHHALRLLEERIAGSALAESMVAAYLIGVPLPADKLEQSLDGIPVCSDARMTGCIVSWNTLLEDADRSRFTDIWLHYPTGWERNGDKRMVCVNPYSWKADDKRAAASGENNAVVAKRSGRLRRVEGAARAQCRNGVLEISRPGSRAFRTGRSQGNYHVYDYSLFHFEIRRNLKERTAAYFR